MRSDTKRKKPVKQLSGPKPRAEDYPVVITWDDEDRIFIASVPAFEGCKTHGKTREEAVENAKEAAELWLEVAEREGFAIPAPPKGMSGKLLVRLPIGLHESIARRAELEGVSINTWVVAALAREDRPGV